MKWYRRLTVWLLAMTIVIIPAWHIDALEVDDNIRTLRSAHCLLHTDLTAAEAREVLAKIDATLEDSADYWGCELTGCIECFVVQELDAWRDTDLPHPIARILIGRVGGAAIVESRGSGIRARDHVYVLASSDAGVAEHEFVHAYCAKAFGTTGPIWYREGMAQLFAFGAEREAGLNSPPETLQKLQAAQPRSLAEITGGDDSTRHLLKRFHAKINARSDIAGLIPVANWSDADMRSLVKVEESYAWNWLLCHLLYHNPNYRHRFRSLGRAYLEKREDWFPRLFRPVGRELVFEYQFTLNHIAPGYRVDLCRWDWDKPARPLTGSRQMKVKVDAARGFQATGIQLAKGCRYRYEATGRWMLGPEAGPIGPDGDDSGQGRVEAVIMKDFQLGQPFPLGSHGRFRSPCCGQLYLRCSDHWNQIADNSGTLQVTFSR